MRVLGISGLDRSVSFNKRELAGLLPHESRILQGLDSAAALLIDGQLVSASAEERFTREKATGAFPRHAVDSCLVSAGLRLSDVDVIAHGFDYRSSQEDYSHSEWQRRRYEHVYSRQAQLDTWTENYGPGPWDEKLVQVPHHLAHAASAYYMSGFDEALILVSDGMGERESATVAVGRGKDIEIVSTVSHRHSLGVLYGLFTLHLGFRFNAGEYKVMGLAPYGDPRKLYEQVSGLVRLAPDGTYTIPFLQANTTELEQQTYRGSLGVLADMFGPRRAPESPLTQRHHDIAAALQAVLQNTLLHTLQHFRRKTHQRNLCMAGGVALNCTANGMIRRSRLFKEVFVQPASGDDGTALGAALVAHQQRSPTFQPQRMSMPFWGPEATPTEIQAALAESGLLSTARHVPDFEALTNEVSQRLAQGQIIGWFQGRMEFGPRALGNRSILADPRGADVRSRVNALVKKREDFRPFAPAVLAHRASQYFEIRESEVEAYAHMLFITDVRKEHRGELPAITHVDGSARVQTVSSKDNARFFKLLAAFEERTGMPILLNTSFNVRGQPIVCSAREAVQSFVDAKLDTLVIGDWLVEASAA